MTIHFKKTRKVSQKAHTKVAAVAGLQLAKTFDLNGTTVTPEVHGNVQYAFGAKTPKGKFIVADQQDAISFGGKKDSRIASTIGCGLMAETANFEYGVTYDATLSKGFVGHKAALKLKVNL